MKSLSTYQNFYFVGIGGIGMSALARYFNASGKNVLGYDKMPTKLTQALQSEGIDIDFEDVISDKISSLTPESTLVIFTPAIKKLEILSHFNAQNFDVLKRAKVLGMITGKNQQLRHCGNARKNHHIFFGGASLQGSKFAFFLFFRWNCGEF